MSLIGDLVSQVTGAIDSLTNIFGSSKDLHKYPASFGTVNVNQITNNIDDYKTGDWRESRGYSFRVIRVIKDGASETIQTSTEWKPFDLQINPQELTQDEIFAIEVTPTLRGVLVEHHGTVLKDISISGTTGNSPNRREGGATRDAGLPILQSGHSGYQEFHELRSYFRAYVEAKRVDGKTNGELRMIFDNKKDAESLYVEPQKFTMKRSASKPFMYDYVIALKAVGVAGKPGAGDPPFLDGLDKFLDKADDYFQLADGIISGSIGLIRRIESDIFDTILNPLRQINIALNAIRGGEALLFGEFGITRRFVEDFEKECQRVEANWADAIGKSSPEYDEATGRTTTNVAPSGRQPTNEELTVSNALAAAKKASMIILGQSEQVFEKNAFETGAEIVNQFGDGTLISFDAPSSTREISILATDDIQTIAARELGDVDKFRDIVILNNLKPPYISDTGGPGVLKTGDKILLPDGGPTTNTGVVKAREFEITKNMREAEKNLGVDIRITNDGDLAQSNTGDLDLIAGMENMSQAVSVRLGLEKGSLKRHQSLGTNLQLGSKVRSNSLKETREGILESFLQDTRVESIPFIQLKQEGGTTFIDMLLKLKESNQPIPIPLQIKNG